MQKGLASVFLPRPQTDRQTTPLAAALTPKDPAQQALVGRSLLYCWPSVGWCVGVITEANGDGRRKVDGEVINFFAHYEIDGDSATPRSMCSPWRTTAARVWEGGSCSRRSNCCNVCNGLVSLS